METREALVARGLGMRRGLIRGSRFSPGNMDREALENLFVGRHAVLADIVEKVTVSVQQRKEKHYVLIIGPRGSGTRV